MIVLLAALLSGAMFYLSQGLSNVWALAWIAPAPLLWLAYTDTARWKVLAASLAAFAAGQIYLLQCYWGQIPLSVLAPFLAFIVLFPLSIWLARESFRRNSPVAALLAFPALWTALEFAIGRLSPHGTWGALGYAEVSFPAGIQIARVAGATHEPRSVVIARTPRAAYAIWWSSCRCASMSAPAMSTARITTPDRLDSTKRASRRSASRNSAARRSSVRLKVTTRSVCTLRL